MSWTLTRVGDSALVVAFEQRIDPTINARVVRVARAVQELHHDGVQDVVDSFCAVTVYFKPLHTDVESLARSLEEIAAGETVVREDGVESTPQRMVPVCYGGPHGPDLREVARFGGCSEADVVEHHVSRPYRVYMLGFLPGFAYMGSVHPRIAIPRRSTPRLRVPAGAVGIAGSQTGIYPVTAPGGWHLIGQTPLHTFTLDRADPFLLRSGDIVRFKPIGEEAFRRFVTEE